MSNKVGDLSAAEGDGQSCVSFTPGPWKVQRNARLEIVSTYAPKIGAATGMGWHQGVAHVYRKGRMNGAPYRMPAEANARLIAAAPALYEALQLLQKHVHERHCDPHPMGQSELCKVSSDALALANGSSNH